MRIRTAEPENPPCDKRPPKREPASPTLRSSVEARMWHTIMKIGIASTRAVRARGLKSERRGGMSNDGTADGGVSTNGLSAVRRTRRALGCCCGCCCCCCCCASEKEAYLRGDDLWWNAMWYSVGDDGVTMIHGTGDFWSRSHSGVSRER